MPDDSQNEVPSRSDFASIASLVREHWKARGPATQDVSVALDELHAELSQLCDQYEAGDLDQERHAVAASLDAIGKFLSAQGINELVLAPAMRPLDALHLREQGGLDPMFSQRKQKKGGAPSKPLDDYHRMGVLAALANYWIETHPDGGKIPQRLASAARKFQGRWFGAVSKGELKKARDTVSCEPVDHPAVQIARSFRATLDGYAVEFGASNAIAMAINHLNISPASDKLGNWKTLKAFSSEEAG